MSIDSRLPIVRCAGQARQRGQAHGEALRPHIQATFDRWLAMLAHARRADPRAYVREFPELTEFVARFGREDVLLRLASAFEQAMPWHGRRPIIHVAQD